MAVDFDGSTYLLRSEPLRGVSDGGQGTISCWVKIGLADGVEGTVFSVIEDAGVLQSFSLLRTGANKFTVTGRNASNTLLLFMQSTSTYLSSADEWLHVAASWDLAAGDARLYINRIDESDGLESVVSGTIDWTRDRISVGSADETNVWDGEIYDLILWPDTFIDLNVAADLHQLIGPDNATNTQGFYPDIPPTAGTRKPVGYNFDDIGTPAVYFSGPFVKNGGSGGSFARVGNTFGFSRGPDAYRDYARVSTPGERWFASEQSGWLYRRTDTIIEHRTGLTSHGKRIGDKEIDERTRLEINEPRLQDLIFMREEDDHEDDR